MKPTKMRNKLIYHATFHTKSKQLTSLLSKDLAKKYGKKSVRVREGDSVKILRGEFKGVDGKIADVSIKRNGVAIEGIKKEKSKGDKFDVYIHTSNLVVSSLDTTDKWRIDKLQKGTRPVSDDGITDGGGDKAQKSNVGSIAEQKEDIIDKQDDETTETPVETKKDGKDNVNKDDISKDDIKDANISNKEESQERETVNGTQETKRVDISNAKEDEK